MLSDEHTDTIKLANHILNRVNADPDDDMAMLSRQFLRSIEARDRLEEQVKELEQRLATYHDEHKRYFIITQRLAGMEEALKAIEIHWHEEPSSKGIIGHLSERSSGLAFATIFIGAEAPNHGKLTTQNIHSLLSPLLEAQQALEGT